jgi:hypothetical protein
MKRWIQQKTYGEEQLEGSNIPVAEDVWIIFLHHIVVRKLFKL